MKTKKTFLKEECYSCHHLRGFVLTPECAKGKSLTNDTNDLNCASQRCDGYLEIIPKTKNYACKEGLK